VDLDDLAAGCHGYSGADLGALVREAAMHAFSAAAAQALASLPRAAGWQADAAGAGASGAAAAAAAGGSGGGSGAAAEGLVGLGDFQAGLRRVGPSIVRGAAAEVAPVTWEHVGGLEQVGALAGSAWKMGRCLAGWCLLQKGATGASSAACISRMLPAREEGAAASLGRPGCGLACRSAALRCA
jgi:hypothetical protein